MFSPLRERSGQSFVNASPEDGPSPGQSQTCVMPARTQSHTMYRWHRFYLFVVFFITRSCQTLNTLSGTRSVIHYKYLSRKWIPFQRKRETFQIFLWGNKKSVELAKIYSTANWSLFCSQGGLEEWRWQQNGVGLGWKIFPLPTFSGDQDSNSLCPTLSTLGPPLLEEVTANQPPLCRLMFRFGHMWVPSSRRWEGNVNFSSSDLCLQRWKVSSQPTRLTSIFRFNLPVQSPVLIGVTFGKCLEKTAVAISKKKSEKCFLGGKKREKERKLYPVTFTHKEQGIRARERLKIKNPLIIKLLTHTNTHTVKNINQKDHSKPYT